MSKRQRKEIQEEADAEVAYQKSLADAERFAKALAEDDARTEAQRVAAAEVATALRRAEAARVRAAAEPTPEAAKRTFWQRLMSPND